MSLRKTNWPSVWGLNCVPPKGYIQAFTPRTYGCDLTWKQSLCRCNQDKMRSYWIRVALNPIWLVSLNEEVKFGHRKNDAQGESHVTTEAEIGVIHQQSRNKQDYWQPPETARGRNLFSRAVGAWFQTSSLKIVQNKFLGLFVFFFFSHWVCGNLPWQS